MKKLPKFTETETISITSTDTMTTQDPKSWESRFGQEFPHSYDLPFSYSIERLKAFIQREKERSYEEGKEAVYGDAVWGYKKGVKEVLVRVRALFPEVRLMALDDIEKDLLGEDLINPSNNQSFSAKA